MEQMQTKKATAFIAKHKDILVVSGVIVVLASAAATYYYMKKKKSATNSPGTNTAFMNAKSSIAANALINKNGYPIKPGSRHPEVKILQRYLKIYKENLGTSGSKRDGVDGIYGSKTAIVAQKRLKKTVFTQVDIAGMRKALLSLGK